MLHTLRGICWLAALTLVSVSAAWAAPIPVAHYTFDAANVSGATIFDQSPANNNATSYVAASSAAAPNVGTNTATAPTLVAGVFGNAISLNGTTQYAAANGDLLGLTNAFTIAHWYNRTAGEINAVISTNEQWQFDVTSATTTGAYARVNGSWQVSTGAAPAAGDWVHMAMTWDNTSQQVLLYLNGVAQTPTATGTTLQFNTADHNFYIGTYRLGGVWYTDGAIDELFVYDVVLTGEQINNLILYNNAAVPAPEPSTALLCLVALAGSQVMRRRKQLQRQQQAR